jgi:hypothetical protein
MQPEDNRQDDWTNRESIHFAVGLEHRSSSFSRAAKVFHDRRLAQDGWNCRFSIADCPAVAG